MPQFRFLVASLSLVVSATTLISNPSVDRLPPALVQEHAPVAPDWIRDRTIYEVNVRQYSLSGKFSGVEADLDRIQDLGIGVLWFMPIHPIGEINRKGPLGSYYSISDYYGVNPEFGSPEDFKSLVDAAHARGMKVIIDWVANHTAWDNPLTDSHPEFYETNDSGYFTPPHGTDWSDVIQLDFENHDLWDYMADAMAYWVTEYGIDGFRCDYAVGPGVAFWDYVNEKLLADHPDLYLLAESDMGDLNLEAFHASYAWPMHHVFNTIAKGDAPASLLFDQLNRQYIQFPQGTLLLNFTTNHDENSWNGTTEERLGPAKRAFDMLVYTLPGTPLMYNGQEAGLAKRLEFFENDPIDWSDLSESAFYKTLVELKANHPALQTTETNVERIPTTADEQVVAFSRSHDGERIVIFANLSTDSVEFFATADKLEGSYMDSFSGDTVKLATPNSITLGPWEFQVLTSR